MEFLDEALRLSKILEFFELGPDTDQGTDFNQVPRLKFQKVTEIPKIKFLREKAKTKAKKASSNPSSSSTTKARAHEKKKKRKKSDNLKTNSSQIELKDVDAALNTQIKEPNNNVQAKPKPSQKVNHKVEPEPEKPKSQKEAGRKLLLPASAVRNSNPKRFARCEDCPPCLAEACGECHSCQMWAEHRDKAVDTVACERNKCEKPNSLFGSKVVQDKYRQIDGVCPLRMVNGQVYDFRCYICKVLPRVGSANRSELYRHYTLQHYSGELAQEFGTNLKSCPQCQGELGGKKSGGSGKYISHLGQVHNEVEKYLPHNRRIPISVQAKGGGGRRIRRKQAESKGRVSSNNNNKHWFPEVPEGYNPKGGVREIFPTDALSHWSQTVVIDGFTISNEMDEDVEPLMVSRGDVDEILMPSYEDSLGGRCLVCKNDKKYSLISRLVEHVHRRHGILGGSQYLMLDADRLLKGGYISMG